MMGIRHVKSIMDRFPKNEVSLDQLRQNTNMTLEYTDNETAKDLLKQCWSLLCIAISEVRDFTRLFINLSPIPK